MPFDKMYVYYVFTIKDKTHRIPIQFSELFNNCYVSTPIQFGVNNEREYQSATSL